MPGEAERAAEQMGLSLREFFNRHLAVDWWEADGVLPTVFVLSPAIVGEEAGEEFPGDPRGICVFYQGGRCTIHDAKPHECRVYWCGFKGHMADNVHREVAEAWNTPEHQQQIRNLLGREPEAAYYEGGLLGGLFGGGW
jgi:hypothetical protein